MANTQIIVRYLALTLESEFERLQEELEAKLCQLELARSLCDHSGTETYHGHKVGKCPGCGKRFGTMHQVDLMRSVFE